MIKWSWNFLTESNIYIFDINILIYIKYIFIYLYIYYITIFIKIKLWAIVAFNIDFIAKESLSHKSLLVYLYLRGIGLVWYYKMYFCHNVQLLAVFCADRWVLLEPGIRTWNEVAEWNLGTTGKWYLIILCTHAEMKDLTSSLICLFLT